MIRLNYGNYSNNIERAVKKLKEKKPDLLRRNRENIEFITVSKPKITSKELKEMRSKDVKTFVRKLPFESIIQNIEDFVRKHSEQHFQRTGGKFGTNEIVYKGIELDIDGYGRLLKKITLTKPYKQ